MSAVYRIADAYVGRWAALDPVGATCWGVPGHDGAMTDYSPAGFAARYDHDRRTLAAVSRARAGERDRIAKGVLAERLATSVALYEAGEPYRNLNVVWSPLQFVRRCFDLMPTAGPEDWEVMAARLAGVAGALAGMRATLEEGARSGVVVARRQALACAEQAAAWGGRRSTVPYFHRLVAPTRGVVPARLRRALEAGAAAATAAYAGLGDYLAGPYAEAAAGASERAGPERYALLARSHTGMDVNLADAYAWGLDELARVDDQLRRVAARIVPGEPLERVVEVVESNPALVVAGTDRFRAWLQERLDATVAALDGVHFDIPGPLRRVEACIAPDGGAAAMYYTPPSEDLSRPGRTWYPANGRTRFPLWGEVSIAYHEGVPGHHIQLGHTRHLGPRLSRFQRALAYVPGQGEGWALYAERLMAELGFYERPEYELGMLGMAALRAARVVVDIGLHLGLAAPANGASPAPWSADRALAFLRRHTLLPGEFLASEVTRYQGLPGQAISYKLGEREWLAAREDARRAAGAAFDLKAFHAAALDLGPMGLAQLRAELPVAVAAARRPPGPAGPAR